MNMKHFYKLSVVSLGGIALLATAFHAGIAGLATGAMPDTSLGELAVSDLQALDDPTMDSLRGGFARGGNIEITFGFESVLKVDGVLQTRLSLNIPRITYNPATRQVSYSSIQATSFKAGNLADGLSVSGPGSSGKTGLELAREILSSPLIIQNSANNRFIQNIQNLNLKVKGVDVSFRQSVNKVLTPALIDSIR